MDKVSIVVPIHNTEPYLAECLESLLRQTYAHLEIILVDDGSTDSSLAICQQYARHDKRVTIISQVNSGHGPACNAGIRASSGKFICFCDADDYYFDNTVESLVTHIQQTKANVVTGTAYAFDHQTNAVSLDPYHSQIRINKLNNEDCLYAADILQYASLLSVQYWDKIYDATWLKQHHIFFPDIKSNYDDVPFHWHVLAKAEKISLLRQQLYGYRLNRPQSSYSSINQHQYYAMRLKAQKIVARYNPKLINQFYKSFIDDMSWLKPLDPSINRDFTAILNNVLRKPKLDQSVRHYIMDYVYRQTAIYKAKNKLKQIAKTILS